MHTFYQPNTLVKECFDTVEKCNSYLYEMVPFFINKNISQLELSHMRKCLSLMMIHCPLEIKYKIKLVMVECELLDSFMFTHVWKCEDN